jgi:hypothetical protein
VKLDRAAAASGLTLLLAGAGAAVLLATGQQPVPLAVPRVSAVRAASPAHGTLTLAQQQGRRVLALSLKREASAVRATVTVLDSAGRPVGGLAVTLADGVRARRCGPGCYRALLPAAGEAEQIRVGVRGRGASPARAAFRLPRRWPIPALPVLRRAERALRTARTVRYRDRLESTPGHPLTTLWRVAAPDRLAYRIANGSSAVIIGRWRWDRAAGSKRWLRSRQQPRLELPALPWGPRVENVYLLDSPRAIRQTTIRLALYDPSTPAWYDVTLDAHSFHIRSIGMVAPSHFMRDDYAAYDLASRISPPASRAT